MIVAQRSAEKAASSAGKVQPKGDLKNKQDDRQPTTARVEGEASASAWTAGSRNRRAQPGFPAPMQLQQSLGNQAVLRGMESGLELAGFNHLLSLQPIIGNQGLGRRLQTKLKINMPGDPYEQEADCVAEQVMRMPAQGAGAAPSVTPVASGVQRKCACNGSGDKCDKCQEEETMLQRSASSMAPGYAPAVVHDVLRSPGRPLDAATRAFMEPRFGRDFSSVRIHDDGRAGESARSVDSLAYTVGHNIVLDPWVYGSSTQKGRELLAHELTHVVQQTPLKSPLVRRSTVLRSSPSHLQRRHAASSRPTLGRCRPVQDDLRPAAPWADLQRGFRARCGSAASDVMGQGQRALDDILHGRMPRSPHLPDPRSSVDCVCAVSTPRQAAIAAAAVVGAAGPLALNLYMHFLGGSGAPMTIDVADMIRRSAGVRAKIRHSIARGGMTGTTRLEQSDYGDRELQFAYGAIDCVQWTALPPAPRSWRSNPTTQIRVAMLDYYEFHPGRPGVSQCAHAACVQCVADGNAKNFWTSGDATVSWAQLQSP